MKVVSFVLAAAVVCCLAGPVHAQLTLDNPDWEIILSDYGYSDEVLDKAPGREGREYLSGEWAAAVGYTVGATGKGPIWLEPNFIFPDWTTNSDFTVSGPGMMLGSDNEFGLPTASSTIQNVDLQIAIACEMLDTTTGIEQGAVAASAGGAGSSVTSNRYVFKQSYEITNISGQNITDLQLFQFIHGLNSEVALYDNRDYGGALAAYKYDTYQIGTDVLWGEVNQETLEDVITFHSSVAPSAWESGYYGKQSVDDHGTGKPSVGVHLSVEGNILDGTDFFDPSPPDNLWVSGAQRYDLIDLANNESTSFDVLLSIYTVPEPGTLVLLVLGGLTLLRRKTK